MRATVGLSLFRYSIPFMRESDCTIRTRLMKSGVVISHLLFLCAASTPAVNTGAIHTSTRTPKPALSLSAPAQRISARERCTVMVFVHVPDTIKITPRRDRHRAPRQTFVQRKEPHPLRMPSGAGICFVCAGGAPDALVPQRAGRIFSHSLHDAHEGPTQPHFFAAIARSSVRPVHTT
jgi:hypothetical protein